jgi:hypothetical protein
VVFAPVCPPLLRAEGKKVGTEEWSKTPLSHTCAIPLAHTNIPYRRFDNKTTEVL